MRKPSAATILAAIALFVSLGGAAVAASGTDFILGRNNTAKAKTSLTAPVAGNALQITNTLPGGSALGLSVDSGSPPFTTNSSTKVPNLNSDLLDGQNSTAFLGVDGTAANANKLDGLDSTQFVQGGGKVSAFQQIIKCDGCAGQSQPVGTLGPFAVVGDCVTDVNGATGARIRITNNSGAQITFSRDDGGGDPSVYVINPGQQDANASFKVADHVIWEGEMNNTSFTIDDWNRYFPTNSEFGAGVICSFDVALTIYP